MSVINVKALSAKIGLVRANAEATRELIQGLLPSCAYYAMKDGNVTPFNQLLEAAVKGRVTTKGIIAWAELFAPVYIKNEQFQYSKNAAGQIHVTSEADFKEYEAEMVQVKWYEIVGEEKVKSTWQADAYLENVIKTLRKHGVSSDVIAKVELAEMEVRVAKAALEAEMAE
jgi:hypothetical protein